MSDTRKDKRAPISLKVRFKSATLDEFIEQYSVDISKGGIFIKSKTPMSIGTLLKFEFRLKDDSRLIHGVGRVVWKREEDTADKPPGMGIKFIKMDPESRSLVEQMVAKRGEAPGRFEEGQEAEEAAPAPAPFFPSTTPESELPAPEDRTQVRHASEFLASALAEGDAKSASKEAEKKAEEARKRSEEIEKKRAEAKRKPRIKKTLVGVGIPAESEAPPPALEEEPVAIAKGAIEDEPAESEPPAKLESDRPAAKVEEVSESAETKAIDRAELAAADEDEEPAPIEAKKAEPEEPEEEEEPAAKAQPPEKKKAVEPEKPAPKAVVKPAPEKAAVEKAPEPAPKPRPKLDDTPAVAHASAPEESSSKTGMIFFAVVAAAAIGLVIYFQMQPAEEPAQNDQPIATQPSDDTPEVEPADDPVLEEEQPEDLAAEDPQPEEPAVPTTAVNVRTTPEGATVFVDGAEQGTAPLEVQLPVGQAATVSARMTGYTEASQQVTAQAEGQSPITLTLQQMQYVIHVETTPAGARVRGAPGSVTSPGDITLRRPPTGSLALTAQLRGHEDGTATVELGQFTESEGRMVANVTLALTERAQPVRTPPPPGGGARRPPPTEEGGGSEAAPEGGGEQPAGGGETRPAGGGTRPAGGGTRPAGGQAAGGGEQQPAGGGETRPSGGGGETGGGGGGEEGGGTATPENPF